MMTNTGNAYLLLLRIIDIALAPVVTTDLCAVLKVAIEEHHACFLNLYPKWWSVSVKYRDLSCDSSGGSLQNE